MTTPQIRRVVGTAGHIDHGKTALVRALTGVDCDRLPEEKKRGITIDLGFANWRTDDMQVAFIDVPGHERFVKNMLAGVGGIDAALLVVAADESIKPQTREHFAICRLLRIPTGLVAITKRDLVDDEIVQIVRLEIEELVRGSFLEGRPVLPVSSITGEGMEAFREALAGTVRGAPDRERSRSVFRLPIDRAFTMKGFGSVVTGTTVSGSIGLDEEIELLPGKLRSRARNIQVHGTPRDVALAGERTSINVADLSLDSIRRGQQVVRPSTLETSSVITATLELLDDAPPLKDQARIRFHHFAAELLGSIRIVDGSGPEIRPGSAAVVQVRLESPVVAVAGDRFVIRRYSPSTTIGGGSVLDAHLPKLARNTRPEILDALASPGLDVRLALMARLSGMRGVSLQELRTRTGLKSEILAAELSGLPMDGLIQVGDGSSRRWIHADVANALEKKAIDYLTRFFAGNRVAVGVPKGEFVQKVIPGGTDAAMVDFVLGHLARERIIAVSGDTIDVPGRSRELSGAEGELGRLIERRFRDAGLMPPAVSELIREIPQKPKTIEGVIGFLTKTGRLVRLAEGVYLHGEVLGAAREKLAQHRGKSADVGWFKDLFGITRKVVIPLLELFDREGLTKRVGDQRKIL